MKSILLSLLFVAFAVAADEYKDERENMVSEIRYFAELARDAGARILMMSAYTLEHVESEAMETGALGFFRKPVDPEELIRTIGSCLAGHGAGNGRRSASRGTR